MWSSITCRRSKRRTLGPIKRYCYPPTYVVNRGKILLLELPRGWQQDFLREMFDRRRDHNPSIIVLIEPKMSGSGVDEVCKKHGKSHWVRSEAEGFSGGIWLLWDDSAINVVPVDVNRFFIHALVSLKNGLRCMLTAVYASPRGSVRRNLWAKLDMLVIEKPWILMGDFNCVLRSEERSSGSGVFSSFVVGKSAGFDRFGLPGSEVYLELWCEC